MAGLLDTLNPMDRIYGGLLGSMAGHAAPMLAPVTASTTPQMAAQPSLRDRIAQHLFGGHQFGTPRTGLDTLLTSGDESEARRQGLLALGASLLSASASHPVGTGPTLAGALAQAIQAGRQGFQQQRQQALQEKVTGSQITSQAAQQAKLDALAAKYAPQPNETPEQTRDRLAGYVSEAITVDPTLAGKFNAFAPALFAQPKPAAPTRGITATVQGADGKPHTILTDPTTGKQIADLGVQPAAPKAPKPPTNQQQLAGMYALRMVDDEKDIRTLEDAGVTLPAQIFATTRGSKPFQAAYASMNPDQQRLFATIDDWVAAKLRKESGAQISDQEWASEARRYGPAFGDKQQTTAAKRQLRSHAIEGMVKAAGSAYQLAPADSVLIKPSGRTQTKAADLYSKYGLTPPGGR